MLQHLATNLAIRTDATSKAFLRITAQPLIIALAALLMPCLGGVYGLRGWELPFTGALALPLLATSLRAGGLLNPPPLPSFSRGVEPVETYLVRSNRFRKSIRQNIALMCIWFLITIISTGAYLASLPIGK